VEILLVSLPLAVRTAKVQNNTHYDHTAERSRNKEEGRAIAGIVLEILEVITGDNGIA
jgi:hypothetical protein